MRFRFLFFTSAIIFFILIDSCSKKEKEASNKVNITKDSTGKTVFDLSISQDPSHKTKAAEIEKLFDKLHAFRQFNGALLVAEDGKIIFADAKGYANFTTKELLTVNSSFHLASVSKQFTAMAIMILKEEGKLNYDDDVKKYIPDLPYVGVTIRHLLTHTSGIPNITNYIPHFMTFWDSCAIARNCDLPYMFNKHNPPMQFKPGHRFYYNNTGYALLALIVENISKKPFDEFAEEKIFKPLQMKDTKVYSIVKDPELARRVYGYHQNRRWYALDEDDIRNGLTGEKGVYSSVVDLYKWDQALYTNVLVKQSTLQEAFQYSKVNSGRQINYGFGWRKSKDDPQIVYHFGHWRGFKTCIIRFVDDKKLIVILNNTGSRRIKPLALDVIKILYRDSPKSPDL
ncbi:MAG: beta-lactamase family protein [Cytophagaceae bacterium]|nr:beta-lactamase family protein [Cytophagaceae bacterium]